MAVDTTNNLITLAELKSHMNITSSDNDGIMETFIDGVSWMFNTYTNRKLKARDITEYYDGDGSTLLQLREYPINSTATTIEVYIDTDREYTDQVDSDSLIIYSDEGIIGVEDDTFTATKQSVKVVYNAGYTTIPYDIKMAALDQAKYYFNRWQGNEEGLNSINMETQTVNFVGEDLLPRAKVVLDKYRKVV